MATAKATKPTTKKADAEVAPAAPVTATVNTSDPMAELKGYTSNPFALIMPSLRSYAVNLGTLVLAAVLIIGVTLALVTIGVLVGLATWKSGGVVFGSSIGVVGLFALIIAVVLAPLINVILLSGAKNQKIALGAAVNRSAKVAVKFLLVNLLVFLIFVGLTIVTLGIGALLFVLLHAVGLIIGAILALVLIGFFILIGAWLSLAAYIVIDQDSEPVAALKRSKFLVTEHVWETLALNSLVGTFLGILMGGSTPIRYLQLKDLKDNGGEKPPIHWANWLAIVLSFALSMFNPIQYNPPADNSNQTIQDLGSY